MKVAVLDDYQSVAESLADWSQLPLGTEVTYFSDHLTSEDALAERLAGFDVVMGMRERTPFRRSLLERLPNLRLLVTTGRRNASFDIEAATDLGIAVCGTDGAGEGPTELVWGLILGIVRNIPTEDRLTREGRWGTTVGVGLKGKTIGCLGLGHIGSLVARVAVAFDMNIIAWSQNLTAERASGGQGYAVPRFRHFVDSLGAEPAHPGSRRCSRAGPDETHGLPDQHLSRPHCRRKRSGRHSTATGHRRRSSGRVRGGTTAP